MAFKVGDEAKILANTSGHRFDIGSTVKVIYVDTCEDGGSYQLRGADGSLWWAGDKELELINAAPTQKPAVKVLKERPQGKMVYAVVNADGILELEQDREDARVLKAELGGLKAGVKIVQYAPIKEIR